MGDDDNLPDDQQEDADDLQLQENWFVGPILWSTDWTTETVVTQIKRGNINLNPRFQRRNAWERTRKSSFIESLILGLPIPQIVLAEEKGNRGKFIVIDGKQRLLAIRQFTAEKGEEFEQLRLAGLKDRPDLNGQTYKSMSTNKDLDSEFNNFDNQTIRTVVIRGWTDERYLYSVFLRINTGSVQLSPQELRQALHPGPFSDFIDDFSVESEPLRSAMRLKQADFRMRDVELVLRYFAYANFAADYRGDLKKFLDFTTLNLNKNWAQVQERLDLQAEQFNAALVAVRTIFGERDELRKWNGVEFERKINRAVFDIMIYYLSIPDIRRAMLDKAPEIKEAFRHLCERNGNFRTALESTTKSMEANRTRFEAWANVVGRIINLPIRSPF